MKIFADSYSSNVWRPTANNVTIVARNGDITITGMGGSGVTGIFFAPNGKVTFKGGFLEGVVIARDGFFVESGGTTVTSGTSISISATPMTTRSDTGRSRQSRRADHRPLPGGHLYPRSRHPAPTGECKTHNGTDPTGK